MKAKPYLGCVGITKAPQRIVLLGFQTQGLLKLFNRLHMSSQGQIVAFKRNGLSLWALSMPLLQ